MERYDTLLIACSDPEHRRYLQDLFQDRYHLLEAATIAQTRLLLEHNLSCICAVLVDTSLRDLADKTDLLKEDAFALLQQVPVAVICDDDASPEERSVFFRFGAADVLSRNRDPEAIIRRVGTIVELHLLKQNLDAMAQEKADMIRTSSSNIVDALSSIIEYRSVESGNHILRVRHFTRILLECVRKRCPQYGLTDRLVTIISSASALHDIGKIAIPDAILKKPGSLTREEWDVMQTHTVTGCRILDNLKGTVEKEYLRYAHNICHYHHERWDGSGHPEGLSGDDIPISAQAVGLADSYDALTSTRSYKAPYSHTEAVNMILNGDCGAFSPKLLSCFLEVEGAFAALTQEYADGRSPSDPVFDMTLPSPAPAAENTTEWFQAVYYSLVHYINAFAVELDLDRKMFHVAYNPYPDVVSLRGVNTLEDLRQLALDQIVVPQERDRMERLLVEELPRFIEKGLRRTTHLFHFQGHGGGAGGCFELTLLRFGNARQDRRTLAALLRRVEENQLPASSLVDRYVLPTGTFICRNDQDFTLVRIADHTLRLGDYTLSDVQRDMNGQLSGITYPEDRAWVRQEFDRQLKNSSLVQLEYRAQRKDGQVVWVSCQGRLITDTDGEEYLLCTISDISPTKEALKVLEERIHRYQVILTQTENVLFDWDIATDTLEFTDTWGQVFGQQSRRERVRELLRQDSQFHPDDIPSLMECIHRLENGSNYETTEARVAAHQGRYLWCRFRATALRDQENRLTKIVGIIINIDAEKREQRQLQDQAERDSLTKLLNKTASRKQAERYLYQYPQGVPCALMVIDLDDFKQVNDRYGHLFGDAVLTKTAAAIVKHFDRRDIVARIGGDEFMVLVRGVGNRPLLESRCRALLTAIQNAVRSVDRTIRIGCSIGIALGPEHGKNYFELFSHADQALYSAKAKGKNAFCFYDKTMPPAILASSNRTGSTPIDSDTQPGLAQDNFVRFAFQKLYAAKDVEAAVNEVISLLGRNMNVSRVYIFENSPDNRCCTNTFEWCNTGISPEIHTLQSVSYETDIPGYADNFNEEGIYYCPDVSKMPPKARAIVEAQGIRSMLQCAIRQEGTFLGYIGFDECAEQRLWTKEEISMLTYFSDVLSVFLRKYREQERNRAQAMELHTILENQDNWIYIVEPDTMRLRYMNKRVRQDSPQAQLGHTCYQALLGRNTRCENCPANGLKPGITGRKISLDERFHTMAILAEASVIQWEGAERIFIACRELPKPDFEP